MSKIGDMAWRPFQSRGIGDVSHSFLRFFAHILDTYSKCTSILRLKTKTHVLGGGGGVCVSYKIGG